jgi:type VI secretion system protein VasG
MTYRDLSPIQRRLDGHGAQALADAASLCESQAHREPDSGARNIDSLLDQQVLPVLARELLTGVAQQRLPAHIRLGFSPDDGIVVDFGTLAGEAA